MNGKKHKKQGQFLLELSMGDMTVALVTPAMGRLMHQLANVPMSEWKELNGSGKWEARSRK